MKTRRPLVVVVLAVALAGGSTLALAGVSNLELGTTAVLYSGTVYGQPENVFLWGLAQVTRTVVRDPDFGTRPTVLYHIDLSNVTGQGMTTGRKYVTSGNPVVRLVRPLVAMDGVDVIFNVYASGGTFLPARSALASFTFNYDTVSGTATGTTTSANVNP